MTQKAKIDWRKLPRKAEADKKLTTTTIRMTTEERKRLRANAIAAGLKVSALIVRRCCK